jgi:hypothetical protein
VNQRERVMHHISEQKIPVERTQKNFRNAFHKDKLGCKPTRDNLQGKIDHQTAEECSSCRENILTQKLEVMRRF